MSFMPKENKKYGILSSLADLASIAGQSMPRVKWLTALGMGIKALDTMYNGGNSSIFDRFVSPINRNTFYSNHPAKGNIARTPNKHSRELSNINPELIDKSLIRKWGLA